MLGVRFRGTYGVCPPRGQTAFHKSNPSNRRDTDRRTRLQISQRRRRFGVECREAFGFCPFVPRNPICVVRRPHGGRARTITEDSVSCYLPVLGPYAGMLLCGTGASSDGIYTVTGE